jgi:hypothetical protein
MNGLEFLKPSKDSVFKRIFTECRQYSSFVISYITGIPYEKLLHAVYLNQELLGSKESSKKQYADIILKTDNYYINIECNDYYYKNLIYRNNNYLSRIQSDIILKTKGYDTSNFSIQISFNFVHYIGKKLINKYATLEVNDLERYPDNREIYEIELVFLDNFDYTQSKEGEKFYKCMKFLVCESYDEMEELVKEEPLLKEVFDMIKLWAEDENGIAVYYKDVDNKMLMDAEIRDAKQETKVNTVKNLISLNVDDDIIKKSVEINQEQLDKIKKTI